jgi:hypothetical protein
MAMTDEQIFQALFRAVQQAAPAPPVEALRQRLARSERQPGVALQITYRAAAARPGHPITIATHPALTIKLFPLDEQGDRWTIFLKLTEQGQKTLGTAIRLVDTGGMQWLAGQVDEDAELSADWPHQESPPQRLYRYELRVESL